MSDVTISFSYGHCNIPGAEQAGVEVDVVTVKLVMVNVDVNVYTTPGRAGNKFGLPKKEPA